MKINLFACLIALFAFGACKEDEKVVTQPVVKTYEFAGTWSGTYSGIDNGTWTMNIGQDGSLSGSATSNLAGETFDLVGQADSVGNLTSTISTSTGSTFNGKLVGKAGSGTWVNAASNSGGPWSGTKSE